MPIILSYWQEHRRNEGNDKRFATSIEKNKVIPSPEKSKIVELRIRGVKKKERQWKWKLQT